MDGVGFRKAKVYMEVPGGTIGGYFGAGRPFRIFNTGQHGRVSDIESSALCSAWMGISVAWGILYPVMAIAAWLTLRGSTGNVLPILLLYGAQLLANVIWPLLFFLQRAWGLSFVWLLLVFALALVTCIRFFKSSRWGGGLMVPYLAWLAFAAVLNFSIARLNPQ